MQYHSTAGIDEAGRGALAGPVVAACCVLPTNAVVPNYITDSKKLTSLQREKAFEWITTYCLFGVGASTARYIDTHGIKKATHIAMKKAVKELSNKVSLTDLLVDGNDQFTFTLPSTSIIRGDQLHSCISAASIIAKVTRDSMLVQKHKALPVYGFNKHKGYGTTFHREAILRYGISSYHRQTFVHAFDTEY